MASPLVWLDILSWVKALYEVTKGAFDLKKLYDKYRHDPETVQEAERVSVKFSSTYSEAEVNSLLGDLKAAEIGLIKQGSGADRARCLCSVLQEAMEGNGGVLPLIDDWAKIYHKLNCAKLGKH